MIKGKKYYHVELPQIKIDGTRYSSIEKIGETYAFDKKRAVLNILFRRLNKREAQIVYDFLDKNSDNVERFAEEKKSEIDKLIERLREPRKSKDLQANLF
jgi:hypothetical protein